MLTCRCGRMVSVCPRGSTLGMRRLVGIEVACWCRVQPASTRRWRRHRICREQAPHGAVPVGVDELPHRGVCLRDILEAPGVVPRQRGGRPANENGPDRPLRNANSVSILHFLNGNVGFHIQNAGRSGHAIASEMSQAVSRRKQNSPRQALRNKSPSVQSPLSSVLVSDYLRSPIYRDNTLQTLAGHRSASIL